MSWRTKLGHDYPPAITHPEFFYGNIGVAMAWQVAFLVICVDPRRFRPIMLVGVLEKLGYGVPAVLLYLQGRSPGLVLATGLVDLLMAVLFLAAYQQTAAATRSGRGNAMAAQPVRDDNETAPRTMRLPERARLRGPAN